MKFNNYLRLCVLLAMTSLAFGQLQKARVDGNVKDSTGAVIPSARVTLTNEKTGDQRTTLSSSDGYYMVPSLLPSTYAVRAEAEGLAPAELKSVTIAAGQERRIDLTLNPASVQQSVTVSGGELTAVDTSSARVGTNVNEREVATLPLNGRQLSQLYLMSPGAVTAGGGSYDNIRFNGRSNQQNVIRVDGVESSSIIDASPGNLNGETSSDFRLQSSLENVQEFRVDSSNYPAEFGTGTGGQITIVTKSGSNAFHGGVFEYLRNDQMDARNFFDKGGKSPLAMNQFGGSVGGPIIKDKFFFFASYEGLRQRAGLNFIETVPSAAARARAVDSIKPLLAAYPTGSAPTANPDLSLAYLNGSQQVNEDFGSIRFDYKASEKVSLYARYNRDQGTSYLPLGVTGNALNVYAVPQNGSLSVQFLPRPNLINEATFGYNGNHTVGFGSAPAVPGVDIGAISVNYTGSVALSGIGGQGASASAATPGALVRSNSASNGRAQPYTNYTLTFSDALTWVKGSHTFKIGGELRPVRMYTDRLGGTTYTFSNLNDLLANNPSQIQFLGDVSAPSPFNNGVTGNRLAKTFLYIGYAQDEWRMRPNVTLSYGLRYEYYQVMHEDQNRDVVFNPLTGVIMPADTPFFRSSKNNWGPRLGLTWSPAGLNNKTVLRVGAGYYYGPGQLEDQIQPIESDRVSKTFTKTPYPIDPAKVIANYNINDPKLGYQPRAYFPGYTVPERILSYTASVQQELPFNTLWTVAYVGSQGRNLFLRSWANRITGVTMDPKTGVGSAVREFGPKYAEVDFKTSGGADHYDSLQTTLNRRFAHGLTAGMQYTYGHGIGDSGGSNEAQTAQDPYCYSCDRGNNNFDVRHSANVNALYELPVGKGRKYLTNGGLADYIVGGWEVGGVFNARSGLPLDIKVVRPDVAYRDTRNGNIVGAPILVGGTPVTVPVINTPGGGSSRNVRRPDVVPGVDPFIAGPDKTMYLDPAAFAIPAPGTYGNLGRNALHGTPLTQFDLTLHKRFVIHEATNLEFRAEMYNLFNRANFSNPPVLLPNALGTGKNQLQPGQAFTSAAAGNFGILNSTVSRSVGLGTPRQIQMSLRLNF